MTDDRLAAEVQRIICTTVSARCAFGQVVQLFRQHPDRGDTIAAAVVAACYRR
ncbi:MAG: hypothetical protein V1916_00980 [Patescibacteria group bacterium]